MVARDGPIRAANKDSAAARRARIGACRSESIEPSTRGFSVARRAPFGARTAKRRNGLSTGRPNRGCSILSGQRQCSTAGFFRSPEEAGIRILRHQRSELIDPIHLRPGLIAVPLQIATLPEHSPDAARPHVGCLRHGRFVFLAGRSAPGGADLENLNALPSDAEAEVQLLTNLRRRPAPLHQGIHGPLYARQLKLRERHGRATPLSANRPYEP